MEEVPSNYKTAGIMMLIAGIMNILGAIVLGIVLFLYITGVAFATMGVGILCYVCCLWPFVPLGWGIYELIVGMNVMNGKVVKNASTVSIIGIVVGALNLGMGGVIPLVLEIIATVMFNNDEVKAWIAEHAPELMT